MSEPSAILLYIGPWAAAVRAPQDVIDGAIGVSGRGHQSKTNGRCGPGRLPLR